MPHFTVRPARPDETPAIVALWHATKREAYPYLPLEQGRSLEDDLGFFRGHVEPRCRIWVACLGDEIAGFLALDGSYIDRLYIHPTAQRRGAGGALLAEARRFCPHGLELHTHQQNASARAFYERHGFVAVRFGVSPAPESAPDVEYHWRPARGTRAAR